MPHFQVAPDMLLEELLEALEADPTAVVLAPWGSVAKEATEDGKASVQQLVQAASWCSRWGSTTRPGASPLDLEAAPGA